MVSELRIQIRHDSPHLNFSRSFLDKDLYGYCNSKFDILMIPSKLNGQNLEEAKEFYPSTQGWKITTIESNPTTISYISMKCLCDKTINSQIQQQGGISIYPIRFSKGWSHYQIVCLDNSILSSVVRVLQTYPETKINSIKELESNGIFPSQMISITEFTSDLTEHQLLILIRAFEQGYYEIPRRIRTQDLAGEFKVSRYAVEKTLRKAENKLLTSLMPYLLLKKSSVEN
ncbi:MAG: helix-turn-helix domain-containing protein [Candidatus Heimdallarchaeota archaeon]|nr:MAG: helix-turn-helix domain-containing protein [Candidatus Heimdallarchaeota archaeon]